MKIKKISCTQFAGVRDRDVTFTDGINVIYGKNETGKSTLVNLLSRTLFQKSQLNGKSDKDFFELYFPSATKDSGIAGDFADGNVTFEVGGTAYTLSKEWGPGSRCSLSTPDGVIRDQGRIDEILRQILLYGEGVYSDMLFPSQRNINSSLQTILDISKKGGAKGTEKTDVRKELTDAISQAFAESDGISVDTIERAIEVKIQEIAGKHWDFDMEAPDRHTGRWSKDVGEILKAYYELEDARAVLEEISRLENEADRAEKDYTDKEAAVQKAEEAYHNFSIFANRLVHKKIISSIDEDLKETAKIRSNWPKLAEELQRAKELRTEKANREIQDQYEAAREINGKIAEIDSYISQNPCPGSADIARVKKAQEKVMALENRLHAINLNAAIHLLNDHRVEIVSLHTGEALQPHDGAVSIVEPVRITIPGAAEIVLSPANVDVEEVEREIGEQKKIIAEIFSKFKVETPDALENLAKKIDDAKRDADSVDRRLSMLLNGIPFDKLEEKAKAITVFVRSKEDIESGIIEACGSSDIEKFITARETILNGYMERYGSIQELEAMAGGKKKELEKAKESIRNDKDIPEEYLYITDPDTYLKKLKTDLENKRRLREDALTAKTAAASRLESYKERISDDPAEDARQAERAFHEQKALLSHWRHIEEVFRCQKEKIHGDPMQGIADSFARYLDIISGGRVSSEFPEAGKLNMSIYSGNKLLDYGKLSEGTKETVSLAFRLAVLDHLFPEGGGIIVFDDPFTDMDVDRAIQACGLLRECADRHQVIFLTCREEYMDMLGGNHIQI